ncbi:MAG: hypothetical protein WC831_02595 [Parcubacteria group bacterium]|jgi:hypothetical protein
MNYSELPEFSREFKKYSAKKYRTLQKDLDNFKKITDSIPTGTGKHFNVLFSNSEIKIIKARLFCRTLKGSSMRIIYCFFQNANKIEFIEIYFKGDKENENRERIRDYIKNFEI